MKRLSGALLTIALLALCSGATFAAVFPTLEFVSFDQATFTYTYRVTCPENSTYPFGRLTILAEVPNGGSYFPWGHGADTDPATRWQFLTSDREWDDDFNPTKSNAIWKADLEDVVPAMTAWTGQFMLTVPNSRLVDGVGITMDGGPWSQSPAQTVYVPGPALIPEPGSLLALGGLVGGLLPFIRRRK